MSKLSPRRIYELVRTDRSGPLYDSYWAHVVVAKTPSQAREYAAAKAGDEGPELWKDPARSTIKLIGQGNSNATLGICVSNFNAG